MSVLLHTSDPHFGTERSQVVEALVTLARLQPPELVVLSGDITQRARSGQFRKARAFVDRLGAPVLVISGNHDIPLFNLGARVLHPYARYRAAFGDRQGSSRASGERVPVRPAASFPSTRREGSSAAWRR
jgi:3',5'-cyclic AMP phosphodiesterase CpdA